MFMSKLPVSSLLWTEHYMAGQQQRTWDRFDLEVFCQHCGQYFTTRVGIDLKQLAAAREEVRQEVAAHATAAGRTVEVTWYFTLQRAEMVDPCKDS